MRRLDRIQEALAAPLPSRAVQDQAARELRRIVRETQGDIQRARLLADLGLVLMVAGLALVLLTAVR